VEFFTDSNCATAATGAQAEANTLQITKASFQGDGNCDATCAGCIDVDSSFSLFDSGLPATACVSKLKMTPDAACLGAWSNAVAPNDPTTGDELAANFLGQDQSQSFRIEGCSAPPAPAASSASTAVQGAALGLLCAAAGHLLN
jgi:hypothetical protein